jgi:hypothetical protein
LLFRDDKNTKEQEPTNKVIFSLMFSHPETQMLPQTTLFLFHTHIFQATPNKALSVTLSFSIFNHFLGTYISFFVTAQLSSASLVVVVPSF